MGTYIKKDLFNYYAKIVVSATIFSLYNSLRTITVFWLYKLQVHNKLTIGFSKLGQFEITGHHISSKPTKKKKNHIDVIFSRCYQDKFASINSYKEHRNIFRFWLWATVCLLKIKIICRRLICFPLQFQISSSSIKLTAVNFQE